SELVFATQENSSRSGNRSIADPHATSNLQVGMGFHAGVSRQAFAKCFYFLLRQRRRDSAKHYQLSNSGDGKYSQARPQRDSNKHITRKQGKLKFFPPILPSAHRSV